MKEAEIYSEKAHKLYVYYKRNFGIFILSTLLNYRDTLYKYSKLKSLGKIQTKRYNEMKKHIDELEQERNEGK